jgi:HK97 gp10 family phage protein
MAEMEIKITGLDEIEKRLQQLPEKLRRKAIRQALKDGTEIVRAEAAMKAPRRRPGRGWMGFVERDDGPHLRDNITSKVSVTNKGATGRVGVDYKKVKHGHLVEFGTKPHRIGKLHHPGARKQPFMRPAFDGKGDEAVNTIITQLAQAVEREA